MRQTVDRWMVEQDVQALVLPAAVGEAPVGVASTGDPIMCTMATALDLPALSLPGLKGAEGLPLGLQFVGRRGQDLRLLDLVARGPLQPTHAA